MLWLPAPGELPAKSQHQLLALGREPRWTSSSVEPLDDIWEQPTVGVTPVRSARLSPSWISNLQNCEQNKIVVFITNFGVICYITIVTGTILTTDTPFWGIVWSFGGTLIYEYWPVYSPSLWQVLMLTAASTFSWTSNHPWYWLSLLQMEKQSIVSYNVKNQPLRVRKHLHCFVSAQLSLDIPWPTPQGQSPWHPFWQALPPYKTLNYPVDLMLC